MNSTNKKRENRNGIWRECPNGPFFPIFFQNAERGEAVLFSWMAALEQGGFPRASWSREVPNS